MTKPFVQNAANAAQVKEAEKKILSIRDQQLSDLRAILALKEGRRFVWRYLETCRIFQSSWDPSARIHFNEGMRQIGLMLLSDVNEADPESYFKMLKESKL